MIAKVNGKDGQVTGACQICVHEIFRVARDDTTKGQLTVDLNANADGKGLESSWCQGKKNKDGFRASIRLK